MVSLSWTTQKYKGVLISLLPLISICWSRWRTSGFRHLLVLLSIPDTIPHVIIFQPGLKVHQPGTGKAIRRGMKSPRVSARLHQHTSQNTVKSRKWNVSMLESMTAHEECVSSQRKINPTSYSDQLTCSEHSYACGVSINQSTLPGMRFQNAHGVVIKGAT